MTQDPYDTRIVVLDGHTLNPGDLSWEPLDRLGLTEIHPRTEPERVAEVCEGVMYVLTNKAPLPREVLAALPALRYVGVLATGYNIVDVAAARRQGVTVTNVPAYSTRSVAQMVFAHLLNLTQRVGEHAAGVRAGRWTACPDFCYWDHPLVELDGRTMGIVGLGRIGRAVAALAEAFGMRVLGHDPDPLAAASAPASVERVDLDDLFRRSDVVSLHCPLTDETAGLANARRLALMKPTAYLINTARGPLVDPAALADALSAGRLAGAGLDVLAEEPPPADDPLLGAPHCFLTPHIAWATREARRRLLSTAAENLAAFLAGRPQNVVS